MVKADLTRDYYGDLEIQPGADLIEIKKQFKKLGRQMEISLNGLCGSR
jgi:curved DNA-binding protein CbpA